jgi:aryl-alcohol dehydrogenase-like predicted oxidoreductase
MRYRNFGRTGIKVSEIGLGGHREGVETQGGLARNARFFRTAQERARTVGRAIESGVTYFDTTFGCEIASLGESLRLLNRRDGLFVSAMRVDFFSNWLTEKSDIRKYVRREVEGRLCEFGFDRVEQFLLGAMESGDPLGHPRGALDEALGEFARLRDEGKLRSVGFSCHNPDYAARLLEAFPQFDAVMTPYNFANRVAEGALATALHKSGAAWMAMKTMVWHVYGIPVCVLRHLKPAPDLPFDPAWPFGRLAHRFVLANPRVCTCVPAANSPEAVAENVSASADGPLTAEEREQLDLCERALTAHDSLLLALGGLQEEDLRVRAHALGLLQQKFKGPKVEIDWAADDAEERARSLAEDCLKRLRANPREYLSAEMAAVAESVL